MQPSRTDNAIEYKTQHQQENINAELVNLLYTQAPSAIAGSILVATGVLYMLYSHIETSWLFSWYGFICALTAVRLGLVRAYSAKKQPVNKTAFWYRLFIFITALSAISWALLGTALFPSDLALQAVVAVVLAGISAGGVPYFSGSRLATVVFIAPILLPFSINLFLHDSQNFSATMATLSIIYLGILVLSGFRTYKSIYNTLLLRFENLDLIEKLDKEINERKQTEQLLRKSKEQYALIMDAVPGLIAYVDNQFRIRFANKSFELWFEKPLKDIIDKCMKEVFNDTDYETLTSAYSKSNTETKSYETVMKFQNEKERYVNVTLIPHEQDERVNGLYLLISDVTPRINYLATHDPLTNLPNRSLFMARFTRALKSAHAQNKMLALLFLDLDYFKNVNDTLGHDVGDKLLIKVTERLQECIRKQDTFARLGGDEFTIFFEDITKNVMIPIVNKICHAFESPFYISGHEIFITTSVGISLYPDDGNEIQALLKNADIAMYHAKERGRNTFEFYTQKMVEQMTHTLMLETNLRSALEKGQFFVRYQPIVDIETGEINKMEALLRWYLPEVGLIMPSEFIPIAEKVGLIIPIGEWILRSVCTQNKAWQKEGRPPITIAINISAKHFKNYGSLLKKTGEILEETGLDGKYITIEITESSVIDDIDYSIKTIHDLKKLNITFSLDDFGTGYSSLNYINRLPVDTMKIDRSFITSIVTNEGSAKIVTAIINMAHALTLKVIAEGVETIEQYSILRRLGCDAIQGYLVSPPLKPEEAAILPRNGYTFEQLLKKEQTYLLEKEEETDKLHESVT